MCELISERGELVSVLKGLLCKRFNLSKEKEPQDRRTPAQSCSVYIRI